MFKNDSSEGREGGCAQPVPQIAQVGGRINECPLQVAKGGDGWPPKILRTGLWAFGPCSQGSHPVRGSCFLHVCFCKKNKMGCFFVSRTRNFEYINEISEKLAQYRWDIR